MSSQDYSNASSTRPIFNREKVHTEDFKRFEQTEETPSARDPAWGHNAYASGGRETAVRDPQAVNFEELQLPPRTIRVKTEVTLISSEKVPYRDSLF